jgi:hypothetical protein
MVPRDTKSLNGSETTETGDSPYVEASTGNATLHQARTYKVTRIGSVVLKAGFMCDLTHFLFTSSHNLFYVVSTRFYE